MKENLKWRNINWGFHSGNKENLWAKELKRMCDTTEQLSRDMRTLEFPYSNSIHTEQRIQTMVISQHVSLLHPSIHSLTHTYPRFAVFTAVTMKITVS
jgi:hypothetical protein